MTINMDKYWHIINVRVEYLFLVISAPIEIREIFFVYFKIYNKNSNNYILSKNLYNSTL